MSGSLELWTIYENPRDYPHKFVVRRCVAEAGKVVHDTEPLAVVSTLQEAREELHAHSNGLVLIQRDQHDDPVIVEVWI